MESKLPLVYSSEEPKQHQSRSLIRWLIVCVLASLILWTQTDWLRDVSAHEPRQSRAEGEDRVTAFRWEDITPSTSLGYRDCFEVYQCARLKVPLDWNATEHGSGESVAIAIIRRPAIVPVTDPRYGGAIILNPGGPGGSGVYFTLRASASLQIVADSSKHINQSQDANSSDGGKFFDIISFDPRGINNTTPALSCFPDQVSRESWDALEQAIGFSMNESDFAFRQSWSQRYALGSSCSNINSHVGRYVSTASVVRDMVEIVEKHGEWRENEAKELLATGRHRGNESSIRLRTSWQRGAEKILFWGFSYGTYLGQSFASMYPERVGRMAIDGVIDPGPYARFDYSEDLWDIDKVTDHFASTCYTAGPDKCPIYVSTGPAGIQNRINEILQDIKARPIAKSTDHGPTVVSHSNVVHAIFQNHYKPMTGFADTAQILYDVSQGNITWYAKAKETPTCSSDPQKRDPRGTASMQILCVDGDDLTSRTPEDFRAAMQEVMQGSSMFGELLSTWTMGCYAYTTRAKWRFDGPFGRETAHPILFVTSSHDPVTPHHYAYRASSLFPRSAVLQSKGYGHCTLAMPSLCTAKNVRRYWQTGELPRNGTLCEVDREPFGLRGEGLEGYEAGERDMMQALDDVAENWAS